MICCWLAVQKNGMEYMFHNKPVWKKEEYWEDSEYYFAYRCATTDADDGSIVLPKGTIKRLTGKEITHKDKPIKFTEKYLNE